MSEIKKKFLDQQGLEVLWWLTKEQIDAVVLQGTYVSETSFVDADGNELLKSQHKIYIDVESSKMYSYNGEKYQNVSNQYDATNVFFTEDLLYTNDIGKYKVPASGSGTIAAKGKSVQSVLKDILAEEKAGEITAPSVSVTLKRGTTSVTSDYTCEVGTKITPSFTATFNKGSYTYGPATGLTPTWSITDSNGNSSTSATGSFDEFTVGDTTNYKITAKATYGNGAWATTNLGNNPEEGDLAVRIAAGNKSATSKSIKGARYLFWGYVAPDYTLDSDTIRGLANSKANDKGALTQLEQDTTAKAIILACPVGTRTLKAVVMPSSSNADVTTQFVKQTGTVSVEGANGYTAQDYDVWVYEPATMGGTYSITLS